MVALFVEVVERFDKQQGSEDARRLGQRARSGRSLLYFPEGTFSRVPGLRRFHLGAFVAAVEAGLPVVPIVIRGTRSMLRGDEKYLHRGAISIQIGPPLQGAEETAADEAEAAWQEAVKLRDKSREYILRRCGEPDLSQD